MSPKYRKRFHDLDSIERRTIIENAKQAVFLDKRATKRDENPQVSLMGIVSGGYENNRGLRDRRSQFGDEPGYNSLHGVSFFQITKELIQEFPGEPIKILDVGCGRRRFLYDLEYIFNSKGEQKIKCTGTNIRKMSPTDTNPVMLGENLKFPDDSFHLAITTYAATKYTLNLPLTLDELLRVTKPGGRVHFQGFPGGEDSNRKQFEVDIHDFQVAHSLHVHDNPQAWMLDAHWFRKPKK